MDNTRTGWSRFSVHVTNAQTYLDLKVVADVATIEFRADQFKFPVKESLGVPVLVTDKVQDLLVVGHGVHTWTTERGGGGVLMTLSHFSFFNLTELLEVLQKPGLYAS